MWQVQLFNPKHSKEVNTIISKTVIRLNVFNFLEIKSQLEKNRGNFLMQKFHEIKKTFPRARAPGFLVTVSP